MCVFRSEAWSQILKDDFLSTIIWGVFFPSLSVHDVVCNSVDTLLHKLRFLLAVKARGMRVSKKQENGPVEKNTKLPGKEKTRYSTAGLVPPCPVVKVHRYWAEG